MKAKINQERLETNDAQYILLRAFEDRAIGGITMYPRPAHMERASVVRSAMFEPISNAWIVLEERPSEMKSVRGFSLDWMRLSICLPADGRRAVWAWTPENHGIDFLTANANTDLVRDPDCNCDHHNVLLDLGWAHHLPGHEMDPSMMPLYCKVNLFVADLVKDMEASGFVPNITKRERKKGIVVRPRIQYIRSPFVKVPTP